MPSPPPPPSRGPHPTRPTPGALESLRTRTLAELEHQLELRRIDPAEFERRSERVMDAASALELRPLVADLLVPNGGDRSVATARSVGRTDTHDVATGAVESPAAVEPSADADGRSRARSGAARAHAAAALPRSTARSMSRERTDDADHDLALAFMSGSSRGGAWEPAEHVTAVAIMGGIRLDLREAAFLEGVVTQVSAYCLMGGIEIIVPPDIHVSVAGTGLLGGFGDVTQTAAEADAPRLQVSGLAVMGGIAIKVRDLREDPAHDESP